MREIHILSLGAGVQSTALYLMRNFDYAIFSDTGEEPEEVYRHLEHLKTLNRTPIIITSAGKLGDDLIVPREKSQFASIPAFVKNGEKIGLTRRQCTAQYKIRPIERCIRRQVLGLAPRKRIPRDVRIHQYFGISTDEASRAIRAAKRFEGHKWIVPHWPLIEMGWDRRKAKEYAESVLGYPPPRSACVFCPFHTNQEWARIKRDDPSGWARAVEIDGGLRKPDAPVGKRFVGQLYLHRTCVPLDMVDLSPPSMLDPMTTGECQGMCGL